eukprot:6029905-Prymnesium_polylepis.5
MLGLPPGERGDTLRRQHLVLARREHQRRHGRVAPRLCGHDVLARLAVANLPKADVRKVVLAGCAREGVVERRVEQVGEPLLRCARLRPEQAAKARVHVDLVDERDREHRPLESLAQRAHIVVGALARAAVEDERADAGRQLRPPPHDRCPQEVPAVGHRVQHELAAAVERRRDLVNLAEHGAGRLLALEAGTDRAHHAPLRPDLLIHLRHAQDHVHAGAGEAEQQHADRRRARASGASRRRRLGHANCDARVGHAELPQQLHHDRLQLIVRFQVDDALQQRSEQRLARARLGERRVGTGEELVDLGLAVEWSGMAR